MNNEFLDDVFQLDPLIIKRDRSYSCMDSNEYKKNICIETP
jgi:hypothetical protein